MTRPKVGSSTADWLAVPPADTPACPPAAGLPFERVNPPAAYEKKNRSTPDVSNNAMPSFCPRPGALALEMGAFLPDLALTVHPHPTLGEVIMEAAKAALGECPHLVGGGQQKAKL